ncbi:MAG: exo-alpha-sialidase [Rhodobacteraceae bacterium]|nr:exo-alpha-sialidase [Paracoccaceae bacterium]
MAVHLLLGTNQGDFILDGDEDRDNWHLRGPFCETWPINHVMGDPATGAILAGGGTRWHGVGVWRSEDLGETWTQSGEGLGYPEDGDEQVETVWSLGGTNGRIYAGVKPAGLFESGDGGLTWTELSGLRSHPTRENWMPGGAGLILHSIVPQPDDPMRIWVGISTAGVFATEDGGKSWEPRNAGTRCDFLPEDQRYPEVGQCVHNLVHGAGAGEVLYQQNHCGMYRSDDGGRNWVSIENGLPSSFGFPVAAHPRDQGTVWLMPMNGDSAGRYPPEGRAAVWRSRDGGESWQDMRVGLPQSDAYFTVLRQAMAVDGGAPAGVYFGTSSGSIFASRDEGDSWQEVARHLPLILSVEVLHS